MLSAVSFDRSAGAYIEVPDNKVLDSLTESITVEAWVKTNITAGNFGDDQIVGKYANPKPSETMIMFISGADYAANQGGARPNGFGFETSPTSGWDGSAYCVGSKTLPQAGEWYHVAGTFDHKTGILKIYVNGKQDGERNIKADKIGTNDQPLAIGGNPGNSNRWFNGVIDEVVIYNRALTEAEIERDMMFSVKADVEIEDKVTATWGSIKREWIED
ncbi:LamG domain-containing protein [Candidatus Poribacteria bacterium]|nr:LamG domain-containing protein [Candidatus Poribacteria bacterium]